MSNEKFKVKFGLAVGDTAATIDATTGNIALTNNSTTTNLGITGTVGSNDYWKYGGGATGVDGGYAEIATGDNGTEPIYARQYSSSSINKEMILLDGSGNTTIPGTLAVNGGDITTTQTTGTIFNTTATTVNAFGAATTTNIGSKTGSSIVNGTNRFTSPTVYGFIGGATAPGRGLMISNGNAASFASVRSNIVMRTFPTATATTSRGGLIFENTRGNETTPSALQSGDLIGELNATGYATNGYVSDYVTTIPGTTYFTATENWVNTGGPYPTAASVTNAGCGYIIALQPSATVLQAVNGSRINVLNINPQTTTFRTDAYNFNSKANSSLATLDSSGNLTVTGDLRINGGDIQNPGGTSAITLTSANATTTVRGDVFNVNNAADTNFLNLRNISGKITLSVTQSRATAANTFATMQFNTYRSADGINYTPAQNGDDIGQFKFNGNAFTGTSPGPAGGAGATVTAYAAENWTATANGTKFTMGTIKIGTLTDFALLDGSSDLLELKSTETRILDVNANPVLTVQATNATFAQPVGFPVKTAAAWNAITGAVGQQVCVSDSAVVAGKMAYWSSTATAGWRYIDTNTAI